MGLADRLDASPNKKSVTSACQTCLFVSGLAERDQLAINAWVAAGYQMAELHRECQADGLQVNYDNFVAHFKKGHHLEHR